MHENVASMPRLVLPVVCYDYSSLLLRPQYAMFRFLSVVITFPKTCHRSLLCIAFILCCNFHGQFLSQLYQIHSIITVLFYFLTSMRITVKWIRRIPCCSFLCFVIKYRLFQLPFLLGFRYHPKER